MPNTITIASSTAGRRNRSRGLARGPASLRLAAAPALLHLLDRAPVRRVRPRCGRMSSMASSASSGLRCGRTASTERLMPATAAGGAPAILPATSCEACVEARRSARPPRRGRRCMASAAVSAWPPSRMCSARARPTSAASRSDAPHAGIRPRLSGGSRCARALPRCESRMRARAPPRRRARRR